PKSVLPRLGQLLTDAKLTAPQKARIVDILAASDDASAGQTMLGVLQSDAPAEVKARAIEQLRLFLPTKWKALQGSKELAAVLDDLFAKSPGIALMLVGPANATDRVDAVVALTANDKVHPEVRREAVLTLGRLPGDKSVKALAALAAADNSLATVAVEALGR